MSVITLCYANTRAPHHGEPTASATLECVHVYEFPQVLRILWHVPSISRECKCTSNAIDASLELQAGRTPEAVK